MTTHPSVLAAIEALAAEIESQRMARTVQRSAYVALARHLHRQGSAHLPVLAADLRTLASVETDADWQAGHEQLATLLEALNAMPCKIRQ